MADRCPRSPQHDCGRASLAAIDGRAQGVGARGSDNAAVDSAGWLAGQLRERRLRQRLIPSGTAAQEALVEHKPVDVPRQPDVPRQLDQAPCPLVGPGNAIGAGQRQMRREGPTFGRPAQRLQPAVQAPGEVRRAPRAPSLMPIHRTRGRLGSGNAPPPESVTGTAPFLWLRPRSPLPSAGCPHIRRRAQEAQRQVQAVDARPSAAARMPARRIGPPATSVHERPDRRANVVGHRNRDEESARAGRVVRRPAE